MPSTVSPSADRQPQPPRSRITRRSRSSRPTPRCTLEDTTQTGATWGLDRIDQHALPLSGSYLYERTGTGVTAYIIDTGILPTHQEFGGRASVGADFVGDGQNGIDCNGHGTHVAGTIGGATYGVAKGVDLVAVRVFSCPAGASGRRSSRASTG